MIKVILYNTPQNGLSPILRGILVVAECCRMWQGCEYAASQQQSLSFYNKIVIV